MIVKILMILTVFVNFVIAPVFSSPVFARVKTRYSRARRTKVAGSRGGTGSGNKKAQEQNLMEDFTRFVFSSYGTTLQYGQSYNLQNMLKYSVYKYYKENGSEAELNEQFCFGPYMKLTSTVAGAGGENIDLRATNGTVCTYIKPNTNYAITLIDATDKQISDAVKKNSTPCKTSVDKRRVCITRNGQDLQTMHLTTATYLDTRPYVGQFVEAIEKVQTSCGEFTKQMADINNKLGLGVPLSSGLGMALSGAATAVGYMNYKATKEQEELLEGYNESQQKFQDALDASPFDLQGIVPTAEKDLLAFDWTKIEIDNLKLKEEFTEIPEKIKKEEVVETDEQTDEAKKQQEHYELCKKFFENFDNSAGYLRDAKDGGKDIDQTKGYSKFCGAGASKQHTCIKPTQREGGEEKDTEGAYTVLVSDEDVKRMFFQEEVTVDKIYNYVKTAGNCCETAWTAEAINAQKCEYPMEKKEIIKQKEKKTVTVEKNSENEFTKDEIKEQKIMLKDLQDKLKKESADVKDIKDNYKKSRALDITTAALSGTSAFTSVASMGLSIAAIETIKKSLETIKQCKKDVRDLKILNGKYIKKQQEADEE